MYDVVDRGRAVRQARSQRRDTNDPVTDVCPRCRTFSFSAPHFSPPPACVRLQRTAWCGLEPFPPGPVKGDRMRKTNPAVVVALLLSTRCAATHTDTLQLGEPCDPLADACGEGAYCDVDLKRSEVACIEEGPFEQGEACDNGHGCERGSICVPGSATQGLVCEKPCSLEDDRSPCNLSSHTCVPVIAPDGTRMSFGACRGRE